MSETRKRKVEAVVDTDRITNQIHPKRLVVSFVCIQLIKWQAVSI